MTRIPCPRCVRGTWVDSNNIARRCHYCGGSGNVESAPEQADRRNDETTEEPKG